MNVLGGPLFADTQQSKGIEPWPRNSVMDCATFGHQRSVNPNTQEESDPIYLRPGLIPHQQRGVGNRALDMRRRLWCAGEVAHGRAWPV